MNIFLIKRLTLGLSLAGLLFSVGCEKMDDTQKEFVERGETTYTAKADSLKAFGGRNRIKLSWLLLSDPKIHKYKVYWNNRRDSVESTVVKTAEVDTVKLLMDPMPEGTYHFEVFTYDKLGNSSIKSAVIGKVYGDRYASSLLPRTIRKVKRVDDYGLELEWMTGDEDLANVTLQYTDRSGQARKVTALRKDEFTVLPDFPFGASIKSRSAFLPEKQALDTFFTAYANTVIPTDTVKWNDYNIIYGSQGTIVSRLPNGEMYLMGRYGQGDYAWPSRIATGWQGFNNIFSFADGLLARVASSGDLRYYPLTEKGVFGTMKVIGAGATFKPFTELFTLGTNVIVRKANGELWKYPYDADAIAFGTATIMTGGTTWNQYNRLLGVNGAIIGRKADGTLWRIPVNANGSLATAVKIGDNWDDYTLIANVGDDLIARNAKGELWQYSFNTNGTLTSPKKVWVLNDVY